MITELKNVLYAVFRGISAARKAYIKEVTSVHTAETEKARQYMYRAEMYGKEIRSDMIKRKPKQTIKYGNKVVMLSKHPPVAADFWR